MSARILQVIVGGKPKLLNTSEQAFNFLSVRVGPTALEIKETSGHFDFAAKNLTNVGLVDGRDVSVDGGALDAHVGAGADKHADSQISYTRLDASKKVIQAASDSVDLALNDLDDLKISRSGALAMTGALDFGGFKGLNALNPTTAQDLATKSYVDSVRVFSRIIGNVDAATTANVTLSGAAQTIDSFAAIAGTQILVKNQTDPKENGVYLVAAGAWSRVTQLDNSPVGEIYNGVLVPKVIGGTVSAGKAFVITSLGTGADGLHDIGTDNITWSEFTPASQLAAADGINTTSFASNLIAVQVSQLVGEGIEDDGSNNFRVKLDGATLARSGSGVKVATSGITALEIADNAVTRDEIHADVAGFGLRQNTNGSLERNDASSFTNDNAGTISLRQLVYVKSNGAVDLARANALSTADGALAFVEAATIATTASGLITVRKGAIVPGFSGLTPGADLFISVGTAGAITHTAPSAAGEVYRKVGQALSTTEVMLDYEDAIEIL